ncbi:hypothetical protein KIPB_009341 [Kipferlia bialata]|uniref:Uncharacterized protein n=1 Tax=Kipferlia bialata TaxID=797122 RepID=A0A391NY03_9EUKA|nr:hypothetical protein KIPB_009341 [Kipferlia bialata]|eukprot:g9341.t1
MVLSLSWHLLHPPVPPTPSTHPVAKALGLRAPAKDLQPVLASVADGAWMSLEGEVGRSLWGAREGPVESERDRRERLRMEAETRKAEAAAKNKAKILESRRRKQQKKREHAARRAKAQK